MAPVTLSRQSSMPTLSLSTWPVAVMVPTCMAFLRRSSTGIHAQRGGQEVHVALHRKGRLGDAEAAEGAAGGVVGVHGVAVDLGAAHHVRTRGVGGGPGHHLLAQAGIGAAVAVELGFHRGEVPSFVAPVLMRIRVAWRLGWKRRLSSRL